MNEAAWLFFGTSLTVVIGAIVTVWNSRKASPQAQATLGDGYNALLTQVQARLIALEARVTHLEFENDAYHRLYGPLPKENKL